MRLTNIIVLSLVLILFTGSVILYLLSGPAGDMEYTSTNLRELLSKKQRIKSLLIHKENGEVNSIYLIGYEPITQRMGWIYIPPEATVMAPTLGRQTSIKELYSDLSTETFFTEIKDILNLDLTFYIITRDNQLAEIINLVGGIPLTQASPPKNLKKVKQRWMDGVLTRKFASEAYIDRGIKGLRYRHKTVLLGVIDKLKNTPSLLKQDQIISTIHNRIKTNLTSNEFKHALKPLGTIKKDKIKFLTALIPKSEPTKKLNSERVVNMLPPPIKQIINSSPQRDVIYLEILNGTNISELGAKYRDKLQQLDFIDVVKMGNADRSDHKKSLFIDRSNHPQSAYRLKELLGEGALRIDPKKDLLIDVTFIIGQDLAEIPKLKD